MNLSISEAAEILDMIMMFPPDQRHQILALSDKIASLTDADTREELERWLTWAENLAVQPQKTADNRRGVRGPDRAPRKRKPRGGVTTNAAEA